MTAQLDAAWWREYRHDVEAKFRQREIIIISAQEMVVLYRDQPLHLELARKLAFVSAEMC